MTKVFKYLALFFATVVCWAIATVLVMGLTPPPPHFKLFFLSLVVQFVTGIEIGVMWSDVTRRR